MPSVEEPVEYTDILNHSYWRHKIPLGDGRQTPGMKAPFAWKALDLPEDLTGKTVLDIASWDGLFAYEAERRGADHVHAIDVWDNPTVNADHWNSLRPGKRGFDLVNRYLDSDVESTIMDIYDLPEKDLGTFDIVICPGLIYHLPHPYRAVEYAADVTDELLVIESSISSVGSSDGTAAMQFYQPNPSDYGVENPSRWWSPNLECLKNMALSTGCENAHAFTPPTDNILDINRGYIDRQETLYRDIECETEVIEIQSGTLVTVNYSYEGLARIQFSTGEGEGHNQYQGWVNENSVTPYDPNEDILSRSVETIQQEGIQSFIKKANKKVKNVLSQTGSGRGVVHARF